MKTRKRLITSVLAGIGSVGLAFQFAAMVKPIPEQRKAKPNRIQRVIAKQTLVADSGVTLQGFGESYFLEPATIVFWGYVGEFRFSSKYTGPRWGLFSWRDGTIKTVLLEGDKVKPPYGSDELDVSVSSRFWRNTYVKHGQNMLYIDVVHRSIFGRESRRVYTWDGDHLTGLLGENEEITIAGRPRAVRSAETLCITPEGNAIVAYYTKGDFTCLFVHKNGVLDRLCADKEPLPDGQGVYELGNGRLAAAHVADDGIEIKLGVTPLAQGTPDVLIYEIYHGSGSRLDEAFLGMSEERKYSGAPQDRRPIVFPESVLAQVEVKGMPDRLIRMSKDKTATIIQVGDTDPDNPQGLIDKIDGLNASAPDTILVKVHIKKGNTKLILYDKGKISTIHEFKPGSGGGDVGREFLMGDTLFLRPGANKFLYFMKTWLSPVQQEQRLQGYTLHYYDGQRLWNITLDAPLGELSSLRLVPDGSGRTIVQICAPNKFFSQCVSWLFDGSASNNTLVPVPELASCAGVKINLADMIGIDQKTGNSYFELSDGFYLMYPYSK